MVQGEEQEQPLVVLVGVEVRKVLLAVDSWSSNERGLPCPLSPVVGFGGEPIYLIFDFY